MKKTLIEKSFGLTLILQLFLSSINAQTSSGTKFTEGTWSSVKAKSEHENKYIFVDCYTDWCGPCKWMEQTVFPNDSVGKFYNDHFINFKINVEKGEGIEFKKKYGVNGYPTFIFFDPNGEMVHRAQGSRDAQEFIQLGKNVFIPDSTLYYLQKKYESGNRDSQLILNYIFALKDAFFRMDKYQDIVHEYLESQNKSELSSLRNWEFIKEFITDIKDSTFIYLLNEQDKFIAKYGMQQVYQKIFYTKLDYYSVKKDWKDYSWVAKEYVKLIPEIDSEKLNQIIWNFYENVADSTFLSKADSWGKKLVSMAPNYNNFDTYAHLLFKIGKKEESIATAKRAIEVAKQKGDDFSSTEQFLKNLNPR